MNDDRRDLTASTAMNGDTDAKKRRRRQNKAAALTLHARYDSKELTARARSRFLDRFEREVREQSGSLSDEEVHRRAESLKRAYFTKLSIKAADARRKRSGKS